MYYKYLKTNRVERLFYNWTKMGKMRELDTILKLKSKSYISNISHVPERFEEIISSMIEILNSKMGENWTFFINNDYQELRINLYYPEITVTDDYQNSIKVKDFNVGIELGSEERGMIFNTLKGMCMTPTAGQFTKGYKHSHLYRGTGNYFGNGDNTFCLGTDTDIINLMTTTTEYSPELFELFLHLIDGVLEHESESGVPYIKLNTVPNIKNLSEVDSSLALYLGDELIDIFRLNQVLRPFNNHFLELYYDAWKVPPSLAIEDNNIVVRETNLLNSFIISESKKYFNEKNQNLLCNVGDKIMYHRQVSDTESVGYFIDQKRQYLERNITLVLKDREIPFSVYEEEVTENVMEEDEIDRLLYINPVYKKEIYKKLSKIVNEKIKHETIIKKY